MIKMSSYKIKELGDNNTDQLFKSHVSSVISNQDSILWD
jgi:hypothetical protein